MVTFGIHLGYIWDWKERFFLGRYPTGLSFWTLWKYVTWWMMKLWKSIGPWKLIVLSLSNVCTIKRPDMTQVDLQETNLTRHITFATCHTRKIPSRVNMHFDTFSGLGRQQSTRVDTTGSWNYHKLLPREFHAKVILDTILIWPSFP